jgi:hypothetical protein
MLILVLAAAGGMPTAVSVPPSESAPTASPAATVPASDQERRPRRRDGIAFGLALGGGIGTASGYPNNSQQIGDPAYHSSSPWLPGRSDTLLIMGALTDYLNFGFWLGGAVYSSASQTASDFGVGLRVETFPFLVALPSLERLAAFAQFGLGAGRLVTKNSTVLDAVGTQSFIGVGAFYEWSLAHILGGHLGIGPSLEYDAMWSQPLEEHGLVANARVVFYGAP